MRVVSSPDWLTSRPIAHRGLHDGSVLENTLEAAEAAAQSNYAIECDLQLTADGQVVVFHDDTLDRLTLASGPLYAKSAAELRKIPFRKATTHIPSLDEFLACIGGRTPIFLELKSRWNGEIELVERAVSILAHYSGPSALMSFDPWLVRTLRLIAPDLPRGIIAEKSYSDPEWSQATPAQKFGLRNLTHISQTKPHFVAYAIKDLPAFAPLFVRFVLGKPLLTWTARTQADFEQARRWANQMIFEGFRP